MCYLNVSTLVQKNKKTTHSEAFEAWMPLLTVSSSCSMMGNLIATSPATPLSLDQKVLLFFFHLNRNICNNSTVDILSL